MATITTLKAGNWSDPTVWNGGVLPGVNDYASAGHAVVIDQNITVLGLRITAAINGFTVSGSTNRTVNLTAADGFVHTFSGGNHNVLLITNTATTTINAYVSYTATSSAGSYINCNSSGGVININITNGFYCVINSNGAPILLNAASLNQTVNITGDILPSNLTQPAVSIAGTNNTVNFIGNVTSGSAASGTTGVIQLGVTSTTNCTLNYTGTMVCNQMPTFYTQGLGTVNLNGIIQGSTSLNNAIFSTGNTLVKVAGIVNSYGNVNPIFARKIKIDSALDTTWTYNTDVVNVNKTLYTSGSAQGQPAINNVRSGTVYGANSEYTGTLIMAIPANVRKGVPTDATVGTADLTVNDFWNKLTSELTTSGSVGKLLTDNVDAQISTRATDSGVISELNTSSTDVAVRMRNVSTVGITGQQLAGQG
jgi:hypothetical protein